MELRHLRYFVVVAEEASFSRAAKRLRVSQPAISRQIKTLEDEVGSALFTRGKEGPRLTPAGFTLIKHARDMLRRSTDALLDVRAIAGRGGRELNLGYLASAQAGFLAPALAAFKARFRTTSVQIYEMAPAVQVSALRNGRLDLALVGHHHPDGLHDLQITILNTIPLQMIVPDQHPLASRSKVRLDEFSDDIFVGYNEELFPGRNALISQQGLGAGFEPRLRPCAESLSSVLALVAAGEGVCLIPADVAKMAHPHVTFLALRRPVPTIRYAALTRRENTDPALPHLLTCLQAAAQDAALPSTATPQGQPRHSKKSTGRTIAVKE